MNQRSTVWGEFSCNDMSVHQILEKARRNPGSMAGRGSNRRAPTSLCFLGTLCIGVALGNHYSRAKTCSDRLCSVAHRIGGMSPVILLGLAAVAGTATGQGAMVACLGSLSIDLTSGCLSGSRNSGGSGPYP